MKNPFNIFPKIAYKNSQIQIISEFEDLTIEIYNNDKLINTLNSSVEYPILLNSIFEPGQLVLKCKYHEQIFEQKLEIKDAFRFGSSEFKKAFVFENTEFSFFLFKDRLLLYDEIKNNLLTENHFSPTHIHQIDKTNFLFSTKIGKKPNEIINLGIYNTDTFNLKGELLNEFQELKLFPNKNIVWLLNQKSFSIHCFELVNQTNNCFNELRVYNNFIDFHINEISNILVIQLSTSVVIINLTNLHQTIEITKKSNNAIDYYGNIYLKNGNALSVNMAFSEIIEKIDYDNDLEYNLSDKNFIYIGHELKTKNEFDDLTSIVNCIKEEITKELSEKLTKHSYKLPNEQKITETSISQEIYPTENGFYIIEESIKRYFVGIDLVKTNNVWIAVPNFNFITLKTLAHTENKKFNIIFDNCSNLSVREYHYPILYIYKDSNFYLFSSKKKFTIPLISSTDFFEINENKYLLLSNSTLFNTKDLNNPILKNIEILNKDYFKIHKVIWFKELNKKNEIQVFDLNSCSMIPIKGNRELEVFLKNSTDIFFSKNYALSSTEIIFNPRNLEIKDACPGKIEFVSEELNKIITHRASKIYLSKYNPITKKYLTKEISIEDKHYTKSFLSPNGQFLVFQEDNNSYKYFDLNKNEVIHFNSANFIAFKNDGSLIIEENVFRNIKILDPITFENITPSKYQYYRFMSPDGKLFSHTKIKYRYYHEINKQEITLAEFIKFKKELDDPKDLKRDIENEPIFIQLENNREHLYQNNLEFFNNLKIQDSTKINSSLILKIEKLLEIGISGTEVLSEIKIPNDTEFYNYSAFSNDNNFIGIVGKPRENSFNKSLIMICSISFNEINNTLEINENYIYRNPDFATWICGFSKTGYFATYDSKPTTYLLKVDNNIFSDKQVDLLTTEQLNQNKSNNNWKTIPDKNFLCFSPTGKYLALSEQGYDPISLGGYGHQESNKVYIAKTETGEVINTFAGHGGDVLDKHKKLAFVAFSEDEKRIMTHSTDGVIFIRDLNLS